MRVARAAAAERRALGLRGSGARRGRLGSHNLSLRREYSASDATSEPSEASFVSGCGGLGSLKVKLLVVS